MRKGLLLEVYKSQEKMFKFVKERLKLFPIKQQFKLNRRSSLNDPLNSNSPYNAPLSKRKSYKQKKNLQIDELVSGLPQFLNDNLNLIYSNILTSKNNKQSPLFCKKEYTEDFSSECKDTVTNLNSISRKSKVTKNSIKFQESYLKSCGTQSLHLLKQSINMFKPNINRRDIQVEENNKIEYDENFVNENLKCEEKYERKYDNLNVF